MAAKARFVNFYPWQGLGGDINGGFSNNLVGWSGDSVVWVNKDFAAHTATVAGGWDVNIESEKSARLVLKKPGAFNYYRRFHPNMTGKIIVQPK